MTAPGPPTPVVFAPATPSELLSRVLARLRHPTTVLVCWSRPLFLAALAQDVHGAPDDPSRRALLHDSLLQRAVSRHIRLAFVPTVSHLRAYLAAFPPAPIPAPPGDSSSSNSSSSSSASHHPALLVYGLLELHRDGSEWSAQGLGSTTAALVEAADRSALRAAVVEPRGAKGYETLGEFLGERVPLLSGMAGLEEDDAMSVPVGRVLGRWFDFEEEADEGDGLD